MDQPVITFIVNGKTFSLRASDAAGIGAIPRAERQQLIAFLEAVKRQETEAMAIVQEAVDKARMVSQGQTSAARSDDLMVKPERMGSGDVDALMARLVLEDNSNRKPGPSKLALYKWVLGSAFLIVLLVLVFS